MKRLAGVLVVIAVVALVGLFYGCGGSSGSAGPSVVTAGKPVPPPPPDVPAGKLVGSKNAQPNTSGVFTMNTNGTGEVDLGLGSVVADGWSRPDAQRIVFHSGHVLYTVPRAGGTPTVCVATDEPLLPVGESSEADWSPDGSRIVFKRYWVEDGYNRHAIAVKDLPNGPARLITTGGPGYRDEYPTWSPDGQYVFFNRFGNGVSRLMVVAASGSEEPYPVAPDDLSVMGTADCYRDSTTGKNWIVYDYDGLRRLQVDNTGHAIGLPLPLPDGGYSAFHRFPCWSPDGKFIAFNNDTSTKSHTLFTTYIVNVESGALYKVGDLMDVDWAPVSW